ncbi:hypothetical protein [Streptomyces kebangsaanensis]|uniref:hypothetical protein n=1 Tax=Streptomyces kebangsaanensis TaxID=864058 RepID=UPI00093FDE7E|nr:hypothetical protein [Streptomyces kebangsaanensis]
MSADPAVWAAYLFISTGVWVAGSALVLLLADVEFNVKAPARDAALTAAALLMLLTPTPEATH